MQVLAAVDLVTLVIVFVDSLAQSKVSAAGHKLTQVLALFAEAFMRKHHNSRCTSQCCFEVAAWCMACTILLAASCYQILSARALAGDQRSFSLRSQVDR
jgi:hypothetical protein